MELKKELEKLDALKTVSPEKFETQYHFIRKTFISPAEIETTDEYLRDMLSDSTQRIDGFIEEATVKVQLAKISQIISLSYIAKNYFHKTRNWLYQKLNGCTVNGKAARFTPDEIATLNFALQDISKEIGSTVIKF
ncbi:MAG: DUF5053 domain-containing protein [Tannerella sp.]|jgi:hypothetical protein|nr:DUF5053 domain-containing protein [Tannerella sp.]